MKPMNTSKIGKSMNFKFFGTKYLFCILRILYLKLIYTKQDEYDFMNSFKQKQKAASEKQLSIIKSIQDDYLYSVIPLNFTIYSFVDSLKVIFNLDGYHPAAGYFAGFLIALSKFGFVFKYSIVIIGS